MWRIPFDFLLLLVLITCESVDRPVMEKPTVDVFIWVELSNQYIQYQ
jgi:hypothetical protein